MRYTVFSVAVLVSEYVRESEKKGEDAGSLFPCCVPYQNLSLSLKNSLFN